MTLSVTSSLSTSVGSLASVAVKVTGWLPMSPVDVFQVNVAVPSALSMNAAAGGRPVASSERGAAVVGCRDGEAEGAAGADRAVTDGCQYRGGVASAGGHQHHGIGAGFAAAERAQGDGGRGAEAPGAQQVPLAAVLPLVDGGRGGTAEVLDVIRHAGTAFDNWVHQAWTLYSPGVRLARRCRWHRLVGKKRVRAEGIGRARDFQVPDVNVPPSPLSRITSAVSSMTLSVTSSLSTSVGSLASVAVKVTGWLPMSPGMVFQVNVAVPSPWSMKEAAGGRPVASSSGGPLSSVAETVKLKVSPALTKRSPMVASTGAGIATAAGGHQHHGIGAGIAVA